MSESEDQQLLTVRLLTPDESGIAAGVLAESLLVEPGYIAIMPDEDLRFIMLRTMLHGLLRQSIRHGASWGAFDGETLVGVAQWMPPHASRKHIFDALWSSMTYIRLFIINFRSALKLVAEDRAAASYFPDEPFWYLMGLGVSPMAQGRGVGSKLIQPGLDAAEQAGLPVYLETGTAQNVRFYTRFGFDIREPAAHLVHNGPTHWTMIRH